MFYFGTVKFLAAVIYFLRFAILIFLLLSFATSSPTPISQPSILSHQRPQLTTIPPQRATTHQARPRSTPTTQSNLTNPFKSPLRKKETKHKQPPTPSKPTQFLSSGIDWKARAQAVRSAVWTQAERNTSRVEPSGSWSARKPSGTRFGGWSRARGLVVTGRTNRPDCRRATPRPMTWRRPDSCRAGARPCTAHQSRHA